MSLISLTPLKGASAPPPWSPTDKSGLQLWFKTDAGVTESSGLVSQWDDQSGNSRNATATGALRPTYTTNVLNSLPGISFPSGTYLDFGSTTLFTDGSPMSVAVVWQNATAGGTWYHSGLNVAAAIATRNFAFIASNDSGGGYSDLWFAYTGAAGVPTTGIKATTDVTSAPNSLIINYNGGSTTSTGSWTAYVNGSALTLAAGGVTSTNASAGRIGAWSDGTFNLIGSQFEILYYNSEFTSGERSSVLSYFNGKWGV